MAGLLVCLCAQWCDICEGYRAVFDRVAREHAGTVQFRWLDIEDEEDLLGGIDVDDFPTLLLADEAGVRHFGVVRADERSLRKLVAEGAAGPSAPITAPGPLALARRLGATGGTDPTAPPR